MEKATKKATTTKKKEIRQQAYPCSDAFEPMKYPDWRRRRKPDGFYEPQLVTAVCNLIELVLKTG
ncbi:MAG TPA: hypothetical protein VIY29_22945, partial [Ktedonobacteraceae bacterium]